MNNLLEDIKQTLGLIHWRVYAVGAMIAVVAVAGKPVPPVTPQPTPTAQTTKTSPVTPTATQSEPWEDKQFLDEIKANNEMQYVAGIYCLQYQPSDVVACSKPAFEQGTANYNRIEAAAKLRYATGKR